MSHPASHRRAVVSRTLAAAAWGIGTVVSKHAVEEIPPLTLLLVQLAASLIALALLIRLRRLPSATDPPHPSSAAWGCSTQAWRMH